MTGREEELRAALSEALEAVLWMSGAHDFTQYKHWAEIRDKQMWEWQRLIELPADQAPCQEPVERAKGDD